MCSSDLTITFGSTAITFSEFSSVPAYIGGTNINVNGQTISLTGTVGATNGGTGTTASTGTGSVVLSASPTISSPTFTGSPVAPTPTSGDSSTKVATTAFVSSAVAGGVPSGCILMWSGSVATIPSGWYLCNGANGTPDLRNRFVVGAGSTYSVGGTGGSADAITVSHTHSVTDPGHNHAVPNSNANGSVDGSFVYGEYGTSAIAYDNHTSSATTGISISSTGSSGTNANLPPYYALAYIMKA